MIQRADLLLSVLLCPMNLSVMSNLISTSLSLLVDLLLVYIHFLLMFHSHNRDLIMMDMKEQ